VAFLIYRYVLQMFVFMHASEFFEQFFKSPDIIHLLVFEGNFFSDFCKWIFRDSSTEVCHTTQPGL